MIKLIFVGLWACAITLGSSWAVIAWKSGKAADAAREPDKYAGGLEQVRTKMISVPIIADGAIQGYVIVQLAFSIEAKQLKQMTIKPDAILMDEAFKTIYAGETIDFKASDHLDAIERPQGRGAFGREALVSADLLRIPANFLDHHTGASLSLGQANWPAGLAQRDRARAISWNASVLGGSCGACRRHW